MKLQRYIIVVPMAAAVLSTSALAQQPSPGGMSRSHNSQAQPLQTQQPWQEFHLNPSVRIKLDFRNASVDSVLHVLSQASGIAIIKDPGLTGGITLQSPTQQSLSDAFAMLNAVLNLKNYEVAKQASFLVVRPRQAAAAPQARGFGGGFGGFGSGRASQNVIDVYTLKYANASQLATAINSLFAPSPNQQQNQQNPFAGQGGPGAGQGVTGGGGFGRGRGLALDSSVLGSVKVSSDDYSNSVIVSAPSRVQDQISDIIDSIDKPSEQPQKAQVFKLQYATASDLQPAVQTVLNATTPTGRGGSANQNNRPQQGGFGGFFGRLFGQSQQQSGGSVAADDRTNSLIVTTTAQTLDQIGQVIQQLDKPAVYQGTTWVYTMKNARADVVANLLNASFGNRTTNGPVGGSLTNQTTGQSSLASSSTAGTPTGLNSTSTSARRTAAYNNGSSGLATSSQQAASAATTGLDEQGRVVNVRNLTGQVLLVPNIDTNSIIVVAPPEDRAIVEGILQQMDQVPEQVMIQTLVVEANLDKNEQLGVEWNFLQNNPFGGVHGTLQGSQGFGQQQNTTQPQGLRLTLTAAQYSVFLHALQTDTKFNVLSTPRIFTTNNATAQINISQSLPYVTNQTVDTNGAIFYNYNFLDVGIVLTVTPRITDNGYVTMDVSQTANDFVGYTSFNAPIVNQREAQTTVSVQDGQTVVLGGIINDTVNSTINKVPVLGDIPLLGNLFRSTTKTNNKTELLVFLTPHVVRTASDAEALRNQTETELGKSTQAMLPKAPPPPTTNTVGRGK